MPQELSAPATGEKSIRRWLGLGGGASATVNTEPEATLPPRSLEEMARAELLERITGFLLANRLEVSAANLVTAHAAFSGANARLGRKISLKQMEGTPIAQEWLDEVVQGQGEAEARSGKEQYDAMMTRLQTGVDAFTTTTQSARQAAGSYQVALEAQVGEIAKVDATSLVLSSLADIAKSMMERNRQMEEEMRKSEQEANALRKSLAVAQRDADIDHLTGLPNRRAFETVLERHYREAQEAIEPLCVAFCDIDHFKKINDTHGHETGDRVIQAIAQVLSRNSNENCHVARHGGEEFVMLYRNMTRKEAQARLDEAREHLASRSFVNRKNDEPIGGITFSGGVADVFGFADTRAALAAADEALYRAKQTGRNRILIAE